MTLQIAMLSAAPKIEKFVEEKGEDAFATALESLAPGITDVAILNQKAAEHHGISIETLVNSPNMTTLRDEYRNSLFFKMMDYLKENLAFTDKEAWAIVAMDYLG